MSSNLNSNSKKESSYKIYKLSELVSLNFIELKRGDVISKKDISSCPGTYPIYSSSSKGSGTMGYYGNYMFDEEKITWSIDGGGKFFYRPKHKFSITNVCGYINNKAPDKINLKFLYYVLSEQWKTKTFNYSLKAHPSIISNKYLFPLISINQQNKIVNNLDVFELLINNLKIEIELRKKQFLFLWEQLLSDCKSENETVPLSSIANVLRGERITKSVLSSAFTIPVIHGGTTPMGYYSKSNRDANTTIIINTGTAGDVFFIKTPFWSSDANYAIVPKDNISINSKFLFYCIKNQEQYLHTKVGGGAMPVLSQTFINNLKIALPNLDLQNEVVSKLETIQNLICGLEKELELRKKQFNFIKEKLLNFE